MSKSSFAVLSFCLIVITSSLTVFAGKGINRQTDDAQLNKQGVIALEAGKNRTAEKYFRQAIRKNSKIKFYYNNLAAALIRQKKYKEASSVLKMALDIDPEYVKALSNLAVASFKLGEYIEAYRYYQQAKKADEKYASERFDKERVKKRIREEKKKNPGNKVYDEILERLED